MKERPIIFSEPMVRAILEGHKTQTRRLVRGAPTSAYPGERWSYCVSSTNRANAGRWGLYWVDPDGNTFTDRGRETAIHRLRCPYGDPGDRLWVRETWAELVAGHPLYRADAPGFPLKWRPAIHMPREASRLTLAVESIRVERLQAISDADIRAEGFGGVPWHFSAAWDEIYGKRAPWSANPWVWVVGFRPRD